MGGQLIAILNEQTTSYNNTDPFKTDQHFHNPEREDLKL